MPWRGDADFGSDGIFQGSGIYSGYYNDGMDVFYTGGIFIGYGAGETPAVHEPVPRIETLASGLILGIVVLIVGCVVFQKLQKGFAEEL